MTASVITIRRQLAALALAVALPLIGAIAYATYTARHNAGEAAERTSSQLAGLTASSVQELLLSARAELRVVAKRPLVRGMDPARCDPFLREVRQLNPYWANLNTVNARGQVVCSAVGSGSLPSVAGSEWYERVRRSGRFTVSEPFLGRLTRRWISILVLPVDDRGRRAGYLALPLDLVRFQAFFARLALPSRALVSVVSDSGLIVARSAEARRYVGTRVPPDVVARLHDPPSVATGIDGVRRVYARAQIPGTPWIVTAGTPTSVAYGASDKLVMTVVLTSVGLLVLALAAAMATGRRISRPVQMLAQRARDIAAGRPPAESPRAPHEVVVAAQRLDEMVAALQASELRLSHALEAAGMAAWSVDLQSGAVWRSQEHDRIYGHASPLETWDLETTLAHVVPEDQARVRQEVERGQASGRLAFECGITWPDGSEHWIRVEGRVERDEQDEPARLVGTVADITERVQGEDERHRLEEELRQAQKMEAIGQLAGGVAHDFNNLLTAISGYGELALAHLESEPAKLRHDLEQIGSAGDRAAQLTRQLLAFSRRETLQPTFFDLNAAVRDSETLLQRLLGTHIEIESSLSPDAVPVHADRGQIEQILINLGVNARDAMPGGGALRIETERVRLTDEGARRFDAPAGAYVLLRVSDTGEGMDAPTREHAFEPFFTTKPPGSGTGLGLSTVFGSVRQNDGYIALRSQPGAGATFEILLPLAEPPGGRTAAAPAPGREAGSERILLVEDEPAVRSLTRTILESRGYTVASAADGEEALQLAEEHEFDLLVTDVIMPRLGGRELAARLRRSHPGLRVVFMSGYSYDPDADELESGAAFIHKPFSAHDLAALVRAALDA